MVGGAGDGEEVCLGADEGDPVGPYERFVVAGEYLIDPGLAREEAIVAEGEVTAAGCQGHGMGGCTVKVEEQDEGKEGGGGDVIEPKVHACELVLGGGCCQFRELKAVIAMIM